MRHVPRCPAAAGLARDPARPL